MFFFNACSLFCDLKLGNRYVRHWAKKKHVKSTHYSIGDPDSSLYREVVPGSILANRRRLPNKKLKCREYRPSLTSTGTFVLRPPYPPNVNITLEPFPKNVAGNQHDAHKIGNFRCPQIYKGVEYISLKRLVPYPRGNNAYAFDLHRRVRRRHTHENKDGNHTPAIN